MPMRCAPFAHQLDEWRRWRDVDRCTMFHEQGTGKTKLVVDTAAWMRGAGKIDAILVLAPNGVHRNFVVEEMPRHWDQRNGAWLGHAFQQSKSTNKGTLRDMQALMGHEFPVLALSYDALLHEGTDAAPGGQEWARRFLKARKVLMVADESGRIKNPTAKRTKLAIRASRLAVALRALNGTPVANSPFDVYSQVLFVLPDFWKSKGINSYQGFTAQFGQWGTGYAPGPGGPRKFPKLEAYRNLPLLQQWLSEVGSRVLKADVLDLPPKLYKRVGFEMTTKQRRLYNELRDECLTMLDGEVVSATLAIKRIGRLQQITCGYVPTDEDAATLRMVDDENPRLDLLREIVRDLPHKAIVWARYRKDVDLIVEMLRAEKLSCVRYDGAVDNDGRSAAIKDFQDGDAQFFVANPAVGSTGFTLHAAQTVVYYSCSYNFEDRLQSEDRAHRIGQVHPVQYIDLVAHDSVDVAIAENLAHKDDVARIVTGDALRNMLRT